jgi:hypothetical protein
MKEKTRRVQLIVRIYPDIKEQLLAKLQLDGLSFQSMFEVLTTAYLKNNKETQRLVEKFAESKKNKKKKNELNDMERDELLRVIEREYSPLRDLEGAIKETEEEEEDNNEEKQAFLHI